MSCYSVARMGHLVMRAQGELPARFGPPHLWTHSGSAVRLRPPSTVLNPATITWRAPFSR